MYKQALLFSLLLGLGSSHAADAPSPPPIPDSVPEAVRSADEGLQPGVTITDSKAGIVEEFRHNGQVYMLKITPRNGYPYYLIDSDGDGSLETRRNTLDDPEIVQWRILEW